MELNKLMQGDCLPYLERLDSNSIDAVICDPPYSSGGLHAGARQQSTTAKYVQSGVQIQRLDFPGDNRDQRSHLRWCVMWLSECYRVAKQGAPVCIFSDWRQLPLTTDALQAAGFTWRGIVVWDKTEGVRPQRGRFRAQAEYVIWGSKGDMPADRGVDVLPGVFREPVRMADKHHITGKPTELMRQLVRICVPGGVILDPFAGSGSTLVAAAMEGYDWMGVELTPEYFGVAQTRIATVARQ